MREIVEGTKRHTRVVAVDEPAFGANHEYHVVDVETDQHTPTCVKFQKGPIREHGVNGCHNEDLLVIVVDRLKGFQETDFACEENGQALNHLTEAMMWLNKRTQRRQAAGVEGTSATSQGDKGNIPVLVQVGNPGSVDGFHTIADDGNLGLSVKTINGAGQEGGFWLNQNGERQLLKALLKKYGLNTHQVPGIEGRNPGAEE